MRSPVVIATLLVGTALLQGCFTQRPLGVGDHNCPAPTKEQLDDKGFLKLQNGVTLKCQVKNFTNRMACQGITDGTDDGLVCSNGSAQMVFVFDERGRLKASKRM